MSRKRLKQYLMLLLAIGVIAVAMTGGGTFATFNAETTNPGNTFAAGTLYLHDTPNSGTTCTSESATSAPFNINPGDGSNGNTCAALFTAGDLTAGVQTADLALNNAGSINASDIKFDVSGCTWSKTNGASPTFGTDPTDCSGLYLTIQETGSSYTVPTSDVYCAFGPATGNDCNAPNNTATLNTTSLTALKTTGGATAGLNAGATRYYVISIDPSGVGSGNFLQNRTVKFAMTWHLDQ